MLRPLQNAQVFVFQMKENELVLKSSDKIERTDTTAGPGRPGACPLHTHTHTHTYFCAPCTHWLKLKLAPNLLSVSFKFCASNGRMLAETDVVILPQPQKNIFTFVFGLRWWRRRRRLTLVFWHHNVHDLLLLFSHLGRVTLTTAHKIYLRSKSICNLYSGWPCRDNQHLCLYVTGEN